MLSGYQQPSQEQRQAEDEERQRHSIPQEEWDAAFEWSNGGYVEIPHPEARAQHAGTTFQVWPENWKTVCLFQSLSSFWRRTDGGYFRLDYTGVEIVLSHSKLPDPDATFNELHAMAERALEVLHGHE